MKVLMVEPMKAPYTTELNNRLENLQKAVDGYIQVLYPFDDYACIICNEEGKLTGLPCFLENLLPYFRYRRVPKSVPKFERSGPKNVSGKISFPNPYFWQVPTCHKALIYQASGNFPKSGCFLKTNLSIFWGTPHYSPRGTFLYPET